MQVVFHVVITVGTQSSTLPRALVTQPQVVVRRIVGILGVTDLGSQRLLKDLE